MAWLVGRNCDVATITLAETIGELTSTRKLSLRRRPLASACPTPQQLLGILPPAALFTVVTSSGVLPLSAHLPIILRMASDPERLEAVLAFRRQCPMAPPDPGRPQIVLDALECREGCFGFLSARSR